ncbi:GNAT family N-acetyltransferase [Hyphococcus sp.]|uniref:GNAT family N-acetyltransferase n=1 Tax=Hyphococcus sp. TaxID=2038636 RepID=UPI00207E6270|nr:MAG: hypothetical protein DHS20C04_20660 [Marinicaulis sp.]
MIIQINRFTLRAIVETDAPAFAELCNDELLARNTARIPHPFSLDDAKKFVTYASAAFASGAEYPFAVCDGDDIIACAGVKCSGGDFELGYWVSASARGRGVATEAASAVVQFAFDRLGAQMILAGHYTDNPASGRVLQKLGFKSTGETEMLFSRGRGVEAETARLALARADFAAPTEIRFA